MIVTPVPDRPLPLTRYARVAVLGPDDDFTKSVIDGFSACGREVLRLTPETITTSVDVSLSADVVFVTVPWVFLAQLLPNLRGPLTGIVVVACTTSWVPDEHGFLIQPAAAGSVTGAVARALPETRVVGAFHQFTSDHITLATLGALESDVPVIADDREASDLVEDLIREFRGLAPVYAGGLDTAAGVEGIAALLHEVERQRGRPVGFRLDKHRGIRILD